MAKPNYLYSLSNEISLFSSYYERARSHTVELEEVWGREGWKRARTYVARAEEEEGGRGIRIER